MGLILQVVGTARDATVIVPSTRFQSRFVKTLTFWFLVPAAINATAAHLRVTTIPHLPEISSNCLHRNITWRYVADTLNKASGFKRKSGYELFTR